MLTLTIVSIFSALIPLGLGYKNRWTWLWVYPLVGFGFDLGISYFKRVQGLYGEWPINLYLVTEAAFLFTIFGKKLFPDYVNNRRWVLVLFLWAFTITAIVHDPLRYHQWGAIGFYNLYIILSLGGLYALIRRPSEMYLEKSWFFWFSAGILIYASGSFLLFLFRTYLVQSAPDFFRLIWHTVFQLLHITKNIMIALALYHYKPSRN